MKIFSINPVVRISLSLVAIIIAWLLLIEVTIGILPKEEKHIKKARKSTVSQLVSETSSYLATRDFSSIKQLFVRAVAQDDDIKSIAIRLKNGNYVTKTEDHIKYYTLTPLQAPNIDQLRVEMQADNKPWADFEIAFKSTQDKSILNWLLSPKTLTILGFLLGSIILLSLYLKRVFHYLDPSAVIPDRVKAAFDAFDEGVLMIDRAGFILLSNKTVNSWLGDDHEYFGKHITKLPWFSDMQMIGKEKYPWSVSMDTQESINSIRLDFVTSEQDKINATINCTPVVDANNVSRGALITIDNITEIEKLNAELKQANIELENSREELDKQNEALVALAAKDPMTGCLNRRAFYEKAEQIFETFKQQKHPLNCIMFDIDFFKKVNDNYGHGVGDKVIIAVSKMAFSTLRADDLLCRYGGEEFCLLLPNADLDTAYQVAERIRKTIEADAGNAVLDNGDSIDVTSSFGICALTEETKDLAELIDQADQALYKAKKAGRNKVITY